MNPSRIGRYEVLDRLGRGGMGVVYLARDPKLGRTAAIKLLTDDNDELRLRFAREARSAASLSHVNIVTIYDVGEEDGHPFIAMEYLDGETVAALIRRQANPPVAERLRLIIELCAGLAYAHRRGIIHRDIKPANLMVNSEGTLKILDFGIARVMADLTDSGLTRAGALMGSPHYMSPEQAESQPVDARSDVFSVGLVLYELLAGQRAFPGDNPQVVLSNITSREPRSIRDLLPDIDPDLERALRSVLRKNPADRYQTLPDLSADLDRVRSRLRSATADTVFRGGDTKTLPVNRPTPPTPSAGSAAGSGSNSGSDSGPGPGTPTPAQRRSPNLEAIAQRRVAQVEAALREAADFFKSGQYDDVIDRCEHALLIDPNEARALEMLDLAHRAIEVREVQQWLDEAQSRAASGELTEADVLVTRALQRQPDSARAQAILRDVQQRKRERDRLAELRSAASLEVAKARVHLEAGAFEDAVRTARQALSLNPGEEDAKRLIQLAGSAIEERATLNEQTLKARETVRVAQQFVDAQDFGAALKALRAFTPPHPLVTDAIQSVQRQFADQSRRLADEKDRERLAAAEAARQRATEADAQAAARQAALAAVERGRRGADQPPTSDTFVQADPSIGQLAGTDKRGSLAAWEAGTPGEAVEGLHSKPWYQRPHVLAPVAGLVVTIVIALWWTSGRDAPPEPSLDLHSKTLGAAEADYRAGNVKEAIKGALSIPAGTGATQGAIELLTKIRRNEREAAMAAQDEAEKSGHRDEPAYRLGFDQMKLAEAQISVKATDRTERIVEIYWKARDYFKQAANAGLNPKQLMDKAAADFKKGDTQGSLRLAVMALDKEPRNPGALKFLTDRKNEKRNKAFEEQREAVAAGAKPDSADMTSGDKLLKSADVLAIGRETPKAITLLEDAIGAFAKARRTAQEAAAQGKKQKEEIETALTKALTDRDVPRAKTELDRLRPLDAQASTDWQRRIASLDQQLRDEETARAKAEEKRLAEAKQAEEKRRAEELSKQANASTDSAETKKPADPPPAAASSAAKDREDIKKILDEYVLAFARKNTAEMKKLCPSLPDAVVANYQKEFARYTASNTAYVWSPGTLNIRVTGNSDVREAIWTITERIGTREKPLTHSFEVRRTGSGRWELSGCNDPRRVR